jgi:hypothetical protein
MSACFADAGRFGYLMHEGTTSDQMSPWGQRLKTLL